MTPRHHLDQATLLSYAAGALSPEMAAVAATHFEVCRHCRSRLADADHIGGALLKQQQPTEADVASAARLRGDMLSRLEETPKVELVTVLAHKCAEDVVDPDRLPRSLHSYFGSSWNALRWRWMAPGVRMIRAARTSGDTLILLKIAPGKSMPLHSHGGVELTQVLKGAYDDSLGHFAAGDMADLDSETEHQPVTSPGVPCICVAALNARLRFPSWLARVFQPFVGL